MRGVESKQRSKRLRLQSRENFSPRATGPTERGSLFRPSLSLLPHSARRQESPAPERARRGARDGCAPLAQARLTVALDEVGTRRLITHRARNR